MKKTLAQIEKELGVKISTLRNALNRGKLTGSKVGPVWQIDTATEEFEAWMKRRPAKGRGPKKKKEG